MPFVRSGISPTFPPGHNQKTTLREKVINTENIIFTAEFFNNSIAILIEFNC